MPWQSSRRNLRRSSSFERSRATAGATTVAITLRTVTRYELDRAIWPIAITRFVLDGRLELKIDRVRILVIDRPAWGRLQCLFPNIRPSPLPGESLPRCAVRLSSSNRVSSSINRMSVIVSPLEDDEARHVSAVPSPRVEWTSAPPSSTRWISGRAPGEVRFGAPRVVYPLM
jgi:hypothetical protein